jgi:DNA ligase-1
MNAQLSHSLPTSEEERKLYFMKYKVSGDWFMSEKYDGIRAIWTGETLITRSLRKFSWVPQWFIDKLPKDVPLDGELIIPNATFGEFSSISIHLESPKALEKWEKIVYMVFDSPQPILTFLERLSILRDTKLDKQIKPIKFVIVPEINLNFDEVVEFYNKCIGRGGEGVMLINSKSTYQQGKRSRSSLKYKKSHEGECVVTELCEGKGKYKGLLGKVKCQLPNGKEFFCGTGFDDQQRNSYTFTPNGVKVGTLGPKVGDTITYSCMEIIQKTQIPRMPVFKGVRVDLVAV